jgi:hypothetical protein
MFFKIITVDMDVVQKGCAEDIQEGAKSVIDKLLK